MDHESPDPRVFLRQQRPRTTDNDEVCLVVCSSNPPHTTVPEPHCRYNTSSVRADRVTVKAPIPNRCAFHRVSSPNAPLAACYGFYNNCPLVSRARTSAAGIIELRDATGFPRLLIEDPYFDTLAIESIISTINRS